eukprot:2393308-Rhodomonas_salina.1
MSVSVCVCVCEQRVRWCGVSGCWRSSARHVAGRVLSRGRACVVTWQGVCCHVAGRVLSARGSLNLNPRHPQP